MEVKCVKCRNPLKNDGVKHGVFCDIALNIFNYNDGGRKNAGFKGETGDCVTRAVAIASGRPYKEVYNRLALGNKTQRIGKRQTLSTRGRQTARNGIYTTRQWFKDYMKELGFVWVPTMYVGLGCQVHLKKEELPMGKLVIAVSRHYTTMIDGVINDTWNPSRDGTRCVYGYWQKQ